MEEAESRNHTLPIRVIERNARSFTFENNFRLCMLDFIIIFFLHQFATVSSLGNSQSFGYSHASAIHINSENSCQTNSNLFSFLIYRHIKKRKSFNLHRKFQTLPI